MKITIQINGKSRGPFSVDEAKLLLARRILLPTNQAQYEGSDQWVSIASMPELQASAPPPPPLNPSSAPSGLDSPALETPAETAPSAAPSSSGTLFFSPFPDYSASSSAVEKQPIQEPPSPVPPPAPPAKPTVTQPAQPAPARSKAAPPEPYPEPAPKPGPKRERRRMSPAPFFWIAGLGVIWLGIYLVARQVSHRKANFNDKTAKPVFSVREPGPAIGGEGNGTAGSSDAKRSGKIETGAAGNAIVPGESPLPAATNAGLLVSPPRVLKPLIREKPVMEATLRRLPGNYTLDVSQTPFSGYDRAVLKDVQKGWLDVLAQKELIRGRTGKVVVECRLDAYGRVTELRVVENDLDDLFAWLCQKAVLGPGRYPALPTSLRRMMKNDYRQIRFTFYY